MRKQTKNAELVPADFRVILSASGVVRTATNEGAVTVFCEVDDNGIRTDFCLADNPAVLQSARAEGHATFCIFGEVVRVTVVGVDDDAGHLVILPHILPSNMIKRIRANIDQLRNRMATQFRQ